MEYPEELTYEITNRIINLTKTKNEIKTLITNPSAYGRLSEDTLIAAEELIHSIDNTRNKLMTALADNTNLFNQFKEKT